VDIDHGRLKTDPAAGFRGLAAARVTAI